MNGKYQILETWENIVKLKNNQRNGQAHYQKKGRGCKAHYTK